tara:strand:- start:6817 stop:7215 length:399 start_codon:yes stop_codon:yes gene_type:complete
MNTPTHRFRSAARVVFVLATIALLTATHWPGLTVHSDSFSRMDLIIHTGVFFVWTIMLYNARLVAAGNRSRPACFKRRIIWTIVAGILFAIFDESTQPLFNRVADPLDAMADTLGVLLAVGSIALCTMRFRA